MELIGRAKAGGYAVGYFESWNLESLQGVIDAAEESHSPILIGFNGEFLIRRGRLSAERLSWYAALARAAAETASVPCGLMFNECSNDEWIAQAAELGFSLVMPDDPGSDPGAFASRVAAITRHAHGHGCAVEAEVGHLPCGASGEIDRNGGLTDPEEAARFVCLTGIDVLAVSVGNVHILLRGAKDLNLAHLAEIRKKVALPFDLHGGSGIGADSLREAIRTLGVAKVCYGTYVKQGYLAALRKSLGAEEMNPHKLLGYGGSEDLLVAGRNAVRQAVLEKVELLGCCGRA